MASGLLLVVGLLVMILGLCSLLVAGGFFVLAANLPFTLCGDLPVIGEHCLTPGSAHGVSLITGVIGVVVVAIGGLIFRKA